MDQLKIGKFIAEKRKEKGYTQEQLAVIFGISDRAVSKWERGINLPDASLMLELSSLLGVSVNELLSGEMIEEKNYMEKAEDTLIELKKKNDEYAKQLLAMEWIIGIFGTLCMFILVICASLFSEGAWRFVLIGAGFIILIISSYYALRIETNVGYYECGACHHKYIPSYRSVFLAMHYGRTRYMKCPKCQKWSWNHKTMNQ